MLTNSWKNNSKLYEGSKNISKTMGILPLRIGSALNRKIRRHRTIKEKETEVQDILNQYWDAVREFSFYEVTCLWCNVDPSDDLAVKIAKSKRYPIERFLLGGIINLELPVQVRWPANNKHIQGIFEKYSFEEWVREFELSLEQIEASKSSFQITRNDLERFALSIGQRPLFLFKGQAKSVSTKPQRYLLKKQWKVDLDDKISQVKIRFENDEMLIIKGPGKDEFSYHCKQLGFRDSNAKTWKFLLEFLAYPDEGFYFGRPYSYSEGHKKIKNRDYDAKWKLCDELCKKLLAFFNREYNWGIPPSYKLYEDLEPGNRTRYKFKFGINKPVSENRLEEGKNEPAPWHEEYKEKYRNLTEEKLEFEIRKLTSDYEFNLDPEETIPEKLVIAYEVGRDNHSWSDDKFKVLITR